MSLFDPSRTVVSVTDVTHMVEDEEARSSRAVAMNWLSTYTPSLAILDMYLKDGDGCEIALILQARGVPIIFCSGASASDLPEDFRAASWVHKPASG
ncbi:hypothetical protein [Pararhizobium sp. PWRC1-1]|uniref:hypothetical protein n=1 Tax=Pararhizobium sp. PWRC1-1 TaxID=2804566 RepID=UPI003CFAD3D9